MKAEAANIIAHTLCAKSDTSLALSSLAMWYTADGARKARVVTRIHKPATAKAATA